MMPVQMKCGKVQTRLAGYLDDAMVGHSVAQERAAIRAHLEDCRACRQELQRYRKLSVLLSYGLAAAQAQPTQDFPGKLHRFRDRAELFLDNVFRPISLPATGGFFSAIIVFVLVLQVIAPGLTVQAGPNDVPLNILRPAELITLSDYPAAWAPEQHEVELSLPHGLLVDVTVDQHGQMVAYQIISGPHSADLRHQLDQMLLFSRFRPMMSFGRPTSGGHVILSFSAVRVRG